MPNEIQTVETLTRWALCESPSHDAAAVNAMQDLIIQDLPVSVVRVERIPGREGLGDTVLLHAGPTTARERLLVIGHVDTVHPIGTADGGLPVRRDGDRLYGPGLYDMKGGVYAAVRAMVDVALRGESPRPITMLLSPDEEIGSPTTRDLIEAIARTSAYALVVEPARAGGAFVTARKGVGWFNLDIEGRPSHAGTHHADGRSAIREAAHQILRLEGMTDYAAGTTVSVGQISGGTSANVVPGHCCLVADIRVTTPQEGERLTAAIEGLRAQDPDAVLNISGGLNRPPYARSEGTAALYRHVQQIAERLGQTLSEVPMVGGGSDGNFTAALGLPTLDGLGVEGSGAHTLEEYCLVSSVAPRVALLRAMFETL
ncbi:M20 family metallopeptidase [Sphingomonas oligophenolica]|uniref:M20 family metallopeptidase n=1 Tax=Sphingomonas oligophenolica TaxID=301154 RepID=A0ABU9XWU8_9SPHN